jgi:sulfatase modifying factor 1
MKTFLRLLSLWLTVASLISPLTGQSVSELELEKSANLNVWESVTITPEMISGSGKLLVPASGSQQFYRMKIRLPDMALIPQGAFTMGNSVDEDPFTWDAPTRTVTLDAFYMDKYEVTKAEWDVVRTWGLSNGYTDLSEGAGKADDHPVNTISWFDMVKWCNARSQKEGLTPVYYADDAQATIYKTGDVDVTNAQVKWSANGYRLPTEAEWEKASRGGLSGKRFPWGDTISHSQANYYASSSFSYDSSGSVNYYHPTYATGSAPNTSPVGAFAANGYGLYDMAGNVSEFCWDWHGTYAADSQVNPRGSTSGSHRVLRGGDWNNGAITCRVALRGNCDPTFSFNNTGFRVVRSLAP